MRAFICPDSYWYCSGARQIVLFLVAWCGVNGGSFQIAFAEFFLDFGLTANRTGRKSNDHAQSRSPDLRRHRRLAFCFTAT